jgi:flagellar hook protein FlgE
MAFDIALTGLAAAASDLNVTADNIANSATTGYKRSRAEFADMVARWGPGSTTIRNATGDGVSVAAITQQFTQGGITYTERPLDLAISGQGLFRLNDNGAVVFSRDGAFGTDRDGFIVNNRGQRLTGYPADVDGNIAGTLTDLQLSSADVAPWATSAIDVAANLDAAALVPTLAFDPTNSESFNFSTSLSVFDSLGAEHLASLYYRKTADNTWEHYLTLDSTQIGGADTLTFDTAGDLLTPATGLLTKGPIPVAGAADLNLTIDVSELTQFGGDFGVNTLSQDGYSSGKLVGVTVEDDGILFARYTNGQSTALGQVALAEFTNVQGLQRIGDNAWVESFASGAPRVGTPGTSTLGLIESGALEESNVDLTVELVNLINAQRNYQANAQVISTGDTLTQTILNIR